MYKHANKICSQFAYLQWINYWLNYSIPKCKNWDTTLSGDPKEKSGSVFCIEQIFELANTHSVAL